MTFQDDAPDEWPEAGRLIGLAQVRDYEPCETCGQPKRTTLVVDLEKNAAFLTLAFELAGKLLDRQYRVTAEHKAALLAFEGGRIPQWIEDLLAWCS